MKAHADICCSDSMACGCCEGTQRVTPERTANRPGLTSLAYRVGTYATFLETMKARLSSHCFGSVEECAHGAGRRPLAALTTREDSDASIAMLNAWATVGDVLTFYQERIANEGYLRTATERRSVLELARLVGYRLRPGVAASVYLAYTIDDNTKEEVRIPRGARAQSVPGPEELPQSFETSEELKARASWNRLEPRQTQPQTWESITKPNAGTKRGRIYLKGISTNLKPNDPLLIGNGSGTPQLFRVIDVEPDAKADRTEIHLQPWAGTAKVAPHLELVRETVSRLIDAAPDGVTAKRVVEHLDSLGNAATAVESTKDLLPSMEQETLPLLEASLHDIEGLAAPKLRPWLLEVESAVKSVMASASAPNFGTGALAIKAAPFSERLNKLIARPSTPPSNALRLPRKLEESFTPASDSGLQVLGAVHPELKLTLPVALSTYAKASPEPSLEVYAFRQKAGLFGHNFPKRQGTVRNVKAGEGHEVPAETTETRVIGEWPIVLTTKGEGGKWKKLKATESETLLYLDASYENILPDSWLVLDFSAVPVFREGEILVEPAVFPDSDEEKKKNPSFRRFKVMQVKNVQAKISRAEYGASGDTTRIDLSDADAWLRFEAGVASEKDPSQNQTVIDNDFQIIRSTAVYTQSERLELAEEPVKTEVCGGAEPDKMLELDGLYAALEPGRFLVVSGERTDIADTTGVTASEAVMITEVVHDVRSSAGAVPLSAEKAKNAEALAGDRNHTFIRLEKALSYCYRRDAVTIYGNVVKATHGETRNESLGSGDGAKALQSFALKQSPLTYLAAPTAVGAESTLQVFVNDVRWHEAESFVGLSPTDHRFITKTDDEGKTAVVFGNGKQGARLPTGIENTKAAYRNGIGKPGNVRAGQITLLSTRPLGVREVINPLRASGGADRESRDQARKNAPLAVKALDRLVSARDYQDFARVFAGIGKADAIELTDGRRNVVHVTIAGAEDIPIDEGSDLFLNLRRALTELGDPFQPVVLALRELLLMVVSAKVRILADYQWEPVITAVRTALLDAFGFERRELGEDARSSEVLSAIQAVRGVDYVDLDVFGAIRATVPDSGAESGRRLLTPKEIAHEIAGIVSTASSKGVAPRIVANLAEFAGTGMRAAQIAVLTPEVPGTLILNQIQ